MSRVLCVDDLEDFRELFQMLMEHHGHSVHVAADGEEALEALAGQRFDVAFVDIGLPGVDGFEVARRARELGRDAPRLIAMTGFRAEDEEALPWKTFDVVLTKPVDVQRLLAAVRACPER